jgi:uncharacterized membrane protein
MKRLIDLVRGWPGKPSHPPLTDASIGAYTVGVAMLVAGKLGLESRQMAYGSLIALSGGLALAAPTALTGLLDWLQLERGTARRTTATIHLVTMVTATLVFAGAWLAQRPGYVHGKVESLGLALGLVAEVLLALGGYIGGALVFGYGVRVVKRPDAAVADVLVPGRLEPEADAHDATTPAASRAGQGSTARQPNGGL